MGDVFVLVCNFHMPLALKISCASSGADCDKLSLCNNLQIQVLSDSVQWFSNYIKGHTKNNLLFNYLENKNPLDLEKKCTVSKIFRSLLKIRN
jgi:hypothetical protein